MNDTLNIVWVFAAGIALGVLFFGGLWLTVKKAVNSKRPAMIIFGSFVTRMAIVLVGFYWIGAGNWQRMGAILAGFVIARFLVIYFTKSSTTTIEKEANHET